MSAKPKRIPKSEIERNQKPPDPHYSAFTHQLGAMVIIAKMIPNPPAIVRRFLDEFERKAA